MTFEEFDAARPEVLQGALRALWLEAHGDWSVAHEAAQEVAGADGGRCMLTCTANKESQGTRPTGTGRQGGEWGAVIPARNGSRW